MHKRLEHTKNMRLYSSTGELMAMLRAGDLEWTDDLPRSAGSALVGQSHG